MREQKDGCGILVPMIAVCFRVVRREMKGAWLYVFILGSLFLSVSGGTVPAHAEGEGCFTNLSVDREILEKALEDCEKRIGEAEKLLADAMQERSRAQHTLRLIDREIEALLLNFSSNNNSISDLNGEIADAEREAGVLRHPLQTTESDALRERLEAHSVSLENKKGERERYVRQQYALIEQLEEYIEEKRSLLSYISSPEKEMQQTGSYENRAAAIRNKIFGVRGGVALSFEQALRYAEQVSEITGVRPAFLLGLIRTESRLGHNIGSATYLTAPMHPTRDFPVFPFIIETLGYIAEDMPVSKSPGFGWGGAMGPAQFIPSTWVCLGGLLNEKTNTCMPTTGVIRTNKRLSVGSDGSDVRRLQEFLNRNGFTVAKSGPGSPGNETDQYTHAVGKAVITFQNKYSKRILRQYGYTRGTGSVGPATRNAINQLNFYSGPWRYDSRRDVVRRMTKSDMPSDPWNPRDAFFASALYVQHLGAATDECRAARRYYAGSWWDSRVALNYCRAVVSSARKFERDIAFLNEKQ